MKVVLIYPKFPNTFSSFKYALKFISKEATHPPLGLLTVAAMLPQDWDKKLIDMNVSCLTDKEIKVADIVFISAMTIQQVSVREVISKCKKFGTKIVAGGPLFTTEHEEFDDVDHLVLNEAEITLPPFLDDLQKGCPKHLYSSQELADVEQTPVPLWELINMKKYVCMSLQYSRGCPFNCDFCDVTNLFGSNFRTKSKDQILTELDSLCNIGWRGDVFFVDDNFIGNKKTLKKEILPAIIEKMESKKRPFTFNTQGSVDLADDEELMKLMVKAGFTSVFVGIESPNEESLVECRKNQNKSRDMVACVKKIQQYGMRVNGGFIVGFDSDPQSIFEKQIEFIEKSKIIIPMVGLLNAPRGTQLYHRLKQENRLLKNISGDNTDFSMNFIPKMNSETLIDGFKTIVGEVYSPKQYYNRVKGFLEEYKPAQKVHFHFGYIRMHFGYVKAFFRSIWCLGIKDKARVHFWKLFLWSLLRRPQRVPEVITYAIYGFHFRVVYEKSMRNNQQK